MRTRDFTYTLPEELIAHHPEAGRSDSRLMCLDRSSGNIVHHVFRDLPSLLQPQDLLVFNDTRVIPARLYGRKETGGQVEVLLERVISANCALAQVRASKSPAAGSRLLFPVESESTGSSAGDAEQDHTEAFVTGREGEFFRLEFNLDESLLSYLERAGHMPLPPYIKRQDQQADRERYQTVYGRVPGAVAAPTAGLHFDDALLARLADLGVATAFVTLHVGAGTFQPVRVERLEDHRMHSEWLRVSTDVTEAVAACRERRGRVIAVGTTAVRSLETAARRDGLQPYEGETDIFIYPGFDFRVVDGLITNFHLPESTLLMLVSAFAGQEKILGAYQEAVRERYRFFSYGDAMFIAQHGVAVR